MVVCILVSYDSSALPIGVNCMTLKMIKQVMKMNGFF